MLVHAIHGHVYTIIEYRLNMFLMWDPRSDRHWWIDEQDEHYLLVCPD